jgi:thiol-disulfide isomerase/thioredoxin
MYNLRFLCVAIIVFTSVVQSGRTQPPQADPFAPWKQDSAAAEAESDSQTQAEDPQVRALAELGAKFLTRGFKSSWSPDGKQLVFGHQEAPYAEEGGGLSIYDLTTGKVKRLVPTGKDASWAPGDGHSIAYVDGGYGADEQIWIVEPSGENRRKVVDGGFPSWSPDGKTIYFHSREQRKYMSVSIDADGAAPAEIMDGIWWYPAFSFDGKRIAYRSGGQLVLADRETGTALQQFQIPGGRGFLGSWSPDGKYVAYGGYGFHDVPGLWIVDVQTGDLRQLSDGFATMPVWSPDGSKISMDLRLRSGFEVWVIDANIVNSLPKTAQPRDRYAVPEEGIESLLKFIRELQSFRPGSTQQMLEHRAKSNAALKEAAERILDSETDKSSAAFQVATMVLLGSRVQALGTLAEDEQKQVVADLADALQGKANKGLDSSDLMLAMSVARTLEYAGKTELAADANESFAEAVGRSEDASISRYAEQMRGAARRLRLPGTFLELKGTLLDGSELDWKSYRGKVVLVDFWATWCGPCRAEIPNLKKYYELYRDRGFDVVGISLDRSKQALENFLQTEKLPWVTLYDEKAGGSHPMATYYGVAAIPTVILVDKEGKVVSLRARGEELGQLLRTQLGPVEAEKVRKVDERMQK